MASLGEMSVGLKIKVGLVGAGLGLLWEYASLAIESPAYGNIAYSIFHPSWKFRLLRGPLVGAILSLSYYDLFFRTSYGVHYSRLLAQKAT